MPEVVSENFEYEPIVDEEKTRVEAQKALRDWSLGNFSPANNLFERYGLAAFRLLPEKYWKIKKDHLVVYRGMEMSELNQGPSTLAGMGNEIQRLTSWSWDPQVARKFGRGEDGIVVSLDLSQEDIAFAPLDMGAYTYGKKAEREVVVIDYDLKADQLEAVDDDGNWDNSTSQ